MSDSDARHYASTGSFLPLLRKRFGTRYSEDELKKLDEVMVRINGGSGKEMGRYTIGKKERHIRRNDILFVATTLENHGSFDDAVAVFQ